MKEASLKLKEVRSFFPLSVLSQAEGRIVMLLQRLFFEA